MSQPWENPDYGKKRRLRLALLPLLVVAVVAAYWLLRRPAPEKVAEMVVRPLPAHFASPEDQPPRQGPKQPEQVMGGRNPASTPPGEAGLGETNAARQWADALFIAGKFDEALAAYERLEPSEASSRGRAGICLARLGRWDEAADALQAASAMQPDDFPVRKWLALALYRQNKLAPALQQVRAALALQQDEELLEMQEKLEKEIQVQRNYDDARTANFVVLFDGYEHDEMKHVVLDILKNAYAEIGKELDFFPSRPISVILYTGKDFSDVTRAPEWAGGMYGQLDGKIRVPVQNASGRERELRRVLEHEYTHALLYALAPNCPFWLQEGLAQYCSGDKPVNAAQVIPLQLLSKGFPREPRAAMVAYLESLQVVEDLVEEYGMARMRRLLVKLSGGSDLEAAFTAAYGQPFSRWAGQWRPLPQREE